MPDLWVDVDIAVASVPVNIMPLIDSTDFKTIVSGVAYNASGLGLLWNFVTTAGVTTQTVVTATSGGNYDWGTTGAGMYYIEIPASGGASINNDTEGVGWFIGTVTGALPWRGPTIGFRAAALNNSLIDAGTTGLLAPTTAARTLDVTATGEAGIDWSNIGAPTTTVNLSGTSTLALEPTTAGRKLDVSTTGEAGLDWANIGGKTTANALTQTTIDPTQKVDVDTIKTNPVVNGGTITFPTTATLASTTNLTAGTITTVSGNVTGSVGSVVGAVGSVTGAVGSVTGNVGGNVTGSVGSVVGNVGGSVASVVGAVGSVTGNVGGNVTGSVGSVVGNVGGDVLGDVAGDVVGSVGAVATGGITAGSFAAGAIDNAAIASNAIGAAEIATGAITAAKFAASAIDAAALATDAVAEIRDAIFARAFSAAYGSLTFDQVMSVILATQAAKTSGGATTTFTIRNLADGADVIVATVDASGNRTAVTVTP